MDRLLRDIDGVITLLNTDSNGVLADLTTDPTVAITDNAGATVAHAAVVHAGVGTYTAAIAGTDLDRLGEHAATWTSGTTTVRTQFEVIGAWPFTLAQFRAHDKALADTTKYPAASLIDARNQAMDRMEQAMRVAFTPRGVHELISGKDQAKLIVPNVAIRQLLAVVVDGTVWDVSTIDLETYGVLTAPDGSIWPQGVRNIDVHYEHGWDTPPAEVAAACRKLAASKVVGSSVNERATSISTDAGQFRLSTAGRDGETGLPDVDQVIRSFGMQRPSVG